MTAPLITDTLTTPTATALRDCLAEHAARSSFGPVVDAYVRHAVTGGLLDGCDCTGTVEIDGEQVPANGRGVVRVVSVGPADLTGQGAQRTAGAVRQRRCGVAWVVTYELAIVRCYPLTEKGGPLPAAEAEAQAIKLANDRAALQKAIDCCTYLEKHSGVELVTMVPLGPAGGCAGWSATIRVLQVRG